MNEKITELRIKKRDYSSQLNRIGVVCFRRRQTSDFLSLGYEAGNLLAKHRYIGEAKRTENPGKRSRREANSTPYPPPIELRKGTAGATERGQRPLRYFHEVQRALSTLARRLLKFNKPRRAD